MPDAWLIQGDARALPLADDVTLAYCAGIIDADGTIGIKRNTYSMRKVGDSSQPTYSERICVKQVETHAVLLLRDLFRGCLYHEKANAKRGRRLYSWQVSDLLATTCLRLLLPYLRIKRGQAENCLQLRDVKEQSKRARLAHGRGHVGSAVRPAELSEAMESLCRRAHTLNAVGKD